MPLLRFKGGADIITDASEAVITGETINYHLVVSANRHSNSPHPPSALTNPSSPLHALLHTHTTTGAVLARLGIGIV